MLVVVPVAWLVEGSATAGAATSTEADVVVVLTAPADVVVTSEVLDWATASLCWALEHDAAATATAHTNILFTSKV